MFYVIWGADMAASRLWFSYKERQKYFGQMLRVTFSKLLAVWLVPVQSYIRKFNNDGNRHCHQRMSSATNARFVCVGPMHVWKVKPPIEL